MTEEERIALEEASLAAAPLSRPEPVWAGSAASDIDFANATAPTTRSYAEPGMPASSFMNADVAPTGEVISGSYDSTQDNLRNMKAQEMAMRYKGQQLYASLIQGGATPAEAYRASAHLINFSDPAAAVKMEALMQKNKPLPLETVQRDGMTFYRTGKGGFALAHPPVTKPAPMVKGSIPPDVKQQDSMLAKEIDSKRAELTRGFKYGEDPNEPGKIIRVPITPREKMAMQADIAATEERRKALLQSGGHLNPAYNPNVDQTEWNRIKDRWNNPPPTPESVTAPAPAAAPAPKKELTREVAAEFLKAANGDKAKARKLATDAGYVL